MSPSRCVGVSVGGVQSKSMEPAATAVTQRLLSRYTGISNASRIGLSAAIGIKDIENQRNASKLVADTSLRPLILTFALTITLILNSIFSHKQCAIRNRK